MSQPTISGSSVSMLMKFLLNSNVLETILPLNIPTVEVKKERQ